MIMWTEVDKRSGVAYTLEIEPEDIPVKGNAMASGDDKEDKKVEDWINRQLRSGNLWAWCTVVCTARLGDKEGRDTLGACSYKSTAQFIQPGGYWKDMKAQALADLVSKK